jgi:LuxR family maltose regulon positive regulatory protein
MNQSSIAKITRPKLAGVFPRKRLFKLLDQGREKPVTWVSAPAGAGKTTLVASYLDVRKLSCLWYQLDEGDGDIASFFYYMGLAAKKAAPRNRKPLPLFTPEYLLGLPTFTKRYFENLFSRLASPLKKGGRGGFVIVFDNYQDTPIDSGLHEAMGAGLSAIPDGIRAIVISRSEPPPAFARLHASDAMGIIEWNEIRFTLDETKSIIRNRGRKRLPEEAVRKLHDTADGWVAGLVLMMNRTGIGPERPHAAREFLPEQAFDYFAGEVFDKLDSETRDFLLMASFLPAMTPKTTAKLTDTDNDQAGRILAGLRRNHFFTEQHAGAEAIYQFHPLFRSFLLTRMKESLSREGVLRVQKRAAALLMETGQVEDAVSLLRDAADWEELVRLVLSAARSVTAQGRNRTLEEWIKSIPEEIIEKNPWLLYWLGICRVPFDPAEGRAHFERSFRSFLSQNDTTGTLRAWAGAVNAVIVGWNDIAPFDSYIQWYYEQEGRIAFPSAEIEAEFASAMANAMVWRQPYHPDIGKWVERALDATRRSGNADLRLQACISAAYYYLWTGDAANVLTISDEMRRMSLSPGVSPLALITCKWLEAITRCWPEASPEAALRAIAEALDTENRHGVNVWNHMICAIGVYGSMLKADPAAARDYLDKMKSTLKPGRIQGDCQYHYMASWHCLSTGESSAALSHAELALQSARDISETGLYFPEILCRLGLSNILCERKDYQQASQHLDEAGESAARSRSRILEFMHRLTKARIELEQGNDAAGLPALQGALSLGRCNNFVSTIFWWQPSVMAGLCARALQEGIEREYVQGLIRKHKLMPPDTSPELKPQSTSSNLQLESWPWPVKIYTLGRFELEVDGKPLSISRSQQKPLLMLKALIAFGGEEVSEDLLADALWPEAEGDAARKSFDTTLHRLRKFFGNENAVRIQSGRLSLDPACFWTDIWAFERLTKEAASLRDEDDLKKSSAAIGLYEKAVALYKGHFLPSDTREAWATPSRERARTRFVVAVTRLSRHFQAGKNFEKAIEFLQEGLAVEDLSEELYQGLIASYQQTGRDSEAAAVYHRCRKMLSETLGVEPSTRTEEIYSSLRLTDRSS